ncbi:MAG TPA: restriction endonuclease subunit S [Dehalococcoidia bacterium]|nr:restriction endonuclease subunit S [Dehalococcoidia bacterium]
MATSGRAAGARPGDWIVSIVDSGDIEADVIRRGNLRKVSVWYSPRAERHLLKPNDILVTARSYAVKAALVPPHVTRTVAGPTLLVVRPIAVESGMGHYLWYYLTSRQGRAAIEARIAAGAGIPSLSAAALGEVEVPLPPASELNLLAKLVEASEDAYEKSIAAARLQREVLRDSIIGKLLEGAAKEGGASCR